MLAPFLETLNTLPQVFEKQLNIMILNLSENLQDTIEHTLYSVVL